MDNKPGLKQVPWHADLMHLKVVKKKSEEWLGPPGSDTLYIYAGEYQEFLLKQW